MSDEIFVCAREGCEETYEKKAHNQKYHDDECCRLATNERIMRNYYQRRDRRAGKARICESCNTTKLSRYNDDQICNGCKDRKRVENKSQLSGMLQAVSWQA